MTVPRSLSVIVTALLWWAVLGSAAAGDAAGIAGNAVGLVAAVIALARKRTEDKDAHRPQG